MNKEIKRIFIQESIASISFLSIWHFLPDFGDQYFGRHILGVLFPIKKPVKYSTVWCLQEESRLLGRNNTCFLVPYYSRSSAYKSIIRLYFFGCNIVVVYWCVFAYLLGLVQCIFRVILKIYILFLCISNSVI